MKTVEDLESKLSEPSDALIEDVRCIDGDIMILGVGGKVGPSLARMARNAVERAGVKKRVIGVSRFSSGDLRDRLESHGIETVAADLLDENALRNLPDAPNIIYMAGTKFGTTGREDIAWAMNAYLPGRVARCFPDSRFVVFSTGNVYPLTPVNQGGASEEHPVGPVGEYAQSCLGRERVFEYFSRTQGTPVVQFRLNYAVEMRYGVLVDIARAVKAERPIDLSMGHVNVIWQGDVSDAALRSLTIAASPPVVLNVTGPETASVRWLASRFGEIFGVQPVFENEERDTALLSNASKCHRLFGYPSVPLGRVVEWTAEWVSSDGATIDKPTHFQEREGKF